MSQSSHTFRVFVSSTFSDLKAERNALQENVFPRLRELVAAHGCRFQGIDLRWGVSEEASLDQQTMNICLGEIAHCQYTSPRPNFIVLLGDRYGWCPLPYEIPASEFERIIENITDQDERCVVESWYCRDENALPPVYFLRARTDEFVDSGEWTSIEKRIHNILEREANRIHLSPTNLKKYSASATEQEIEAGALHMTEAPDHVFCFFRRIDDLPKGFNALNFIALVKSRIKKEYSDSLDRSSQELVSEILELSAVSSAMDIAEFITQRLKKITKSLQEKEILNSIWQVFIDNTANDFQNLNETDWKIDEKACKKQSDLKKQLHDYIPQNVFSYQASWQGDHISEDHINQFCDDVYNSLSHIILDEIEHPHVFAQGGENLLHIQPDVALDDEGFAHHRFAEERLRFFVGREEMLATITEYLSNNAQRSLVVVGAGGTGKSALMARAIQQTQEYYPKAQVVYRFIGATPDSSDGRNLLDSLCREISRRYGVNEIDVPTDYRDLVTRFLTCMQLARADRPLILFLDSLDQLSANQDARNLIWLPNELPEHVSIITSTRQVDTLKALQMKQVEELELGGLSRQEGNDLLSQWLANIHRTLQTNQRGEVLDRFEESQGNPLYLKLAYEEARLWSSDSSKTPEHLAPGVNGIMEKNLLRRLTRESSHGEAIVSHTLGYLAASRHGLAEDELIDLLSRDVEVFCWFMESNHYLPADLIRSAIDYRNDHSLQETEIIGQSDRDEESAALAWIKEIRKQPEKMDVFLTEVLSKANGPHLPVTFWSRLFFDLAPYLTEHNVDGNPMINFYHRELGDISTKLFLNESQELTYHTRLADYYRSKADPNADRSWTGKYLHGLSDLPYHLTKAERFDDVFQILTDFKFLEHKAAEVGVQWHKDERGKPFKTYTGILQLQEDYERILAVMLGGAPQDYHKPPLIVTAVGSDDNLSVCCPVCNETFSIKKGDLNSEIICLHSECNTRLKINPFVIHRL